MSILNDCEHVDITEFSGPNLLVDEEDVTEPQALAARNCEYIEGQVRVRRGFKNVWNPGNLVQIMYNWIQQQFNRLIYFVATSGTNGNLVSRDLTTGVETALLTNFTAQGFMAVQAGYRIIMSYFNDDSTSSTTTRIWDGGFISGSATIENVFQPTFSPADLAGGNNWGTFSEPSVGFVTAGLHLFLLVPTTFNGFQTAPGPTAGGAAVQGRFFSAAGNKNIHIQVFPSFVWPSWVNTLQIAMTTVANPNRWYLVPGAIWFVSRGTGFNALFDINIDDATLAAEGTEITNTLFNLYTTPINAHAVVAYNNRIVYLFRALGPDLFSLVATMFVSEPFNPQSIFPATNTLNLPEFRDIITGFSLGSVLYICGPSWTYAYTDNLSSPVNWAPPRRVSGDIGSPFIHGVSQNESRGYAWVCDHSGLFYFDGSVFPILPASYEQTPDWDRINFNAHAHALKVTEIPDDRLVIVRAPLDGSLHSTHLMVWDYTNGITPGRIKYCGLWNIADFPFIGDIEVVQSVPAKVKQLWVSHGTGGPVRRRKTIEDGDATTTNPTALYDDQGLGIDASYKLLAVSQAADGPQMQVGAALRIRGMGQINVNAGSFDQQRTTALAPISAAEISMAPGQRFLRLLDEQSETVSYEVNNGAIAGAFFYWAAIRCYFTRWFRER